LGVRDGILLTPAYERLEDWLSSPPGADDRREMALRLVAQIEQMHQLGICHRDLHLANVVVDEAERPLIVDPDLAIDGDPSSPCYDLFGPDASGAPVPVEHARYPANRGGVWWDCVAEVPSLASGFGPLADLKLRRHKGSSTTPG
jgi:serine/threonine protein kinase